MLWCLMLQIINALCCTGMFNHSLLPHVFVNKSCYANSVTNQCSCLTFFLVGSVTLQCDLNQNVILLLNKSAVLCCNKLYNRFLSLFIRSRSGLNQNYMASEPSVFLPFKPDQRLHQTSPVHSRSINLPWIYCCWDWALPPVTPLVKSPVSAPRHQSGFSKWDSSSPQTVPYMRLRGSFPLS